MTKDPALLQHEIIKEDIRIDKDGVWYYRGTEMIRKDIVDMFYQHLKRDESGRYLIEIGKEQCYVDVEDTPYVIKAAHRSSAEEGGEETIYLLMPDDSVAKLDPASLRQANDNTLYCRVVGSEYEARFSRPSYYQLAKFIEHDLEKDLYFISLNGQSYYIENKD